MRAIDESLCGVSLGELIHVLHRSAVPAMCAQAPTAGVINKVEDHKRRDQR